MVYRPMQSGFSGLLLTLPCSLYSSPTEHTLLKHAQHTHNSGPLHYSSPLTRALFPLTSHDSFSHLLQIFAQKSVSQQASNLFKIILCLLSPIPLVLLCLSSISSVQFSNSVASDSLWPHVSQHAGPPCPSPSPGVHSDSRPLSRWCHPAISLSVVPFSSFPQSLPASESLSQLFTWGGQSTGVSALASFLPKNTQDRSPLECPP